MADPTIRDVARHAQVSVASVSRVLNGLANVSSATQDRVRNAITALGYVPHAGARSLSLARTKAIGVVLPDVHGEFFSEVVRGMDAVASERGYLLLLSNMQRGAERAESAVRAMRGRVDGLLVMAPHLDADAVEAALPATLPAVLINAHGDVRSHSSFGIDNAAGVAAIIEHFVALGRRRIVHIAGPVDNVDAQERRDAFVAAVERLIPGADVLVLPGDFTEESGEAAVRRIVEHGLACDAIFAANDMAAIGALQAARAVGIAVPGRIAIAGFDDVPLARHLGLTTARVGIDELGAHALEKLIAIMEQGDLPPVQSLQAPRLIVRATTHSATQGTSE